MHNCALLLSCISLPKRMLCAVATGRLHLLVHEKKKKIVSGLVPWDMWELLNCLFCNMRNDIIGHYVSLLPLWFNYTHDFFCTTHGQGRNRHHRLKLTTLLFETMKCTLISEKYRCPLPVKIKLKTHSATLRDEKINKAWGWLHTSAAGCVRSASCFSASRISYWTPR